MKFPDHGETFPRPVATMFIRFLAFLVLTHIKICSQLSGKEMNMQVHRDELGGDNSHEVCQSDPSAGI